MAGRAREARMLAGIRRVLDADEHIEDQGRCWVAVRRPHVPLLVQGRHRYDAVVTDRRLILVARHGRDLRSEDVLLVKRFEALVLEAQHQRPTLLQQRIRTDQGTTVVVEWPLRDRALGGILADRLPAPSSRAGT